MALTGFYGSKRSFIGPSPALSSSSPSSFASTMDAVGEACILIGQIETSDGGVHAIDTTGSSSIAWRSSAVTFANAATTVKVGIASVLTTAGPPGRPNNTANVITFDVSRTLIGGSGGITANAMQIHVPDTGSKTIANGDLVAICVQMTARGGTDVVNMINLSVGIGAHQPSVVEFTGGAYSEPGSMPNAFITFSDGATGWIYGGEVYSTINPRTWNNTAATKEYGQLYKLPFPVKIYGIYAWMGISTASADFDMVLYSDPLGTPIAERTVSFDANTLISVGPRRIESFFSSPYSTTTDQVIGAAFKPAAVNISAYYKTLGNAAHRAADPWGTSGYGISRGTGAFANANSSLDHYFVGLFVGAFEAGGAAGRAVQINNDSLVA